MQLILRKANKHTHKNKNHKNKNKNNKNVRSDREHDARALIRPTHLIPPLKATLLNNSFHGLQQTLRSSEEHAHSKCVCCVCLILAANRSWVFVL
jgi:hypothetical protein